MTGSAGIFNRGKLRDVVIALSAVSALACDVDIWGICLSLLFLFSGCLLHFVTKGELIRNVVLCNEGVYKVVRHPFYLANYLIDCSFCLLSGSPYLLAVYPFLFFWAYGPTIRKEERRLALTHGDAFRQHTFQVSQVFPDAHSMREWRGLFKGFSTGRITSNELARICRFLAVAALLMFLHDIREDGLTLLSIPTDYDELIYLGAFVSLSVVSVLTVRLAGRGART